MGRVVHFEIHCDDLDRAERFYTQRRVGAAGGTQVVEPDTVPGVGTVAYFKDTEGNILGALEPVEPGAPPG